MFIILFLVWLIFNGNVTLEIAIFGIVISAAIYTFLCMFGGFSIKKDILFCKKIPLGIWYVFILLWEIIKANFATMKFIFKKDGSNQPAIIKFKSPVRSKAAKVILANSITLTPGTITASLEGDEFEVHCLDKSFSEGIDNSVFVHLLKKMEGEEK